MKRYAASCLVAIITAEPAAAQIISVTPQSTPRHFGYFVGDTISGTTVVTVGPGVTLDPNSLPAPGPVATAIDIRAVATTVSGNISREHHYAITVTYQDFAVPDRAIRIEVPGYSVGFLKGTNHLTAQVGGIAFIASPFRDDIQPVLDPSVLQPDRAGDFEDEAGASWLIGIGATLAAVGATGLSIHTLPLPGHRGRLPPFAKAARSITRQPGLSPTATTNALLSLHEAFDATAGRRVFADDLDDFLAQHRHFAPFRAEVEQFFRLSGSVFFGNGDTAGALTIASIKALSRDLMRAEQRK